MMQTRLAGLLAALALFALPSAAHACSTPETPTFRQELARARNVFVFRLASLRLANTAPGSRKLVGTVEVLRNLKGKGDHFRHVSYQSPRCFGLRLDVGGYFVAATTQDGPVLHLVRGDRSIMDISSDYAQVYPPRRPELQIAIAEYLAGTPLPAWFKDEMLTARTAGFEDVPPPPSRFGARGQRH